MNRAGDTSNISMRNDSIVDSECNRDVIELEAQIGDRVIDVASERGKA